MKIKVLGCSGGIGPGRRTTSLLVDDRVLIDAGTGVCDLSFAAMTAVTDVLVTHAHLDHVAGLALMIDTVFDRISHPVCVRASEATIATLREHLFNWRLWPDFTQLPSAANPRLRYETLSIGQTVQLGDLQVMPFPALHTVPNIGYALSTGGGTFAFTGDTYTDSTLWAALNALPRLDKLMIDCSFTDEDAELGRESRHFTPAVLGRELAHLKHRPELLLTHHKPGAEYRIGRQCARALTDWEYRHLRRGDTITL
jgi:cAMP phosphodiesterase